MNAKLLKGIFGTTDPEEILAKKATTEQRDRPARPKVSRVKLSAEECAALCREVGLKYLGPETLTVNGEEVKYAGYESRVFQYTFTDETVDHYGDVVVAKGVDLKVYKKNPVVLAFHDGRKLPIGRSIKTWYDHEKNDVRGWVLVLDNRVDNSGVSETMFRYLDNGAMTTGSIGFIPKEGGYRRPDEEERKLRKMPKHGMLYVETVIIEFSLTPVPANPSASQKDFQAAKMRGIFTLDNLENARDVFGDELVEKCEAILNKEKYSCECIDCGHKVQSEKHCKEIKCPECGGTMRREERPGSGENDFVAGLEFLSEEPPEDCGDIAEFYWQTEAIADDEEQRPSENSHVCVLKASDSFDKFRSGKRKHDGKEYTVRYGKLKDSTTWEEQEYTYAKATWTASQAQKHCDTKDGKFGAATGKDKSDAVTKIIEYRVALSDSVVEKLDYLANKMTLLCDKLDLLTSSNERVAKSLVNVVPQKGGDQHDEDEPTYTEEQLDQVISNGLID